MCESWTIKKAECQRIDAFELWCWRRLFFFFLVLPVYCYQPITLHPHAHMLSHVTPWTAAHQAPPSMGFSRQESWSGVHCLLHMLSRLVITFLPRSKRLLISWLQSPSAVIWEPKKIKSDTVSPSISHEVMGPDAMIFKLFHSPLSLSSRGFLVPLHNLELRPLEAKSKTHSKSIPAPCAPPLAPALCRS